MAAAPTYSRGLSKLWANSARPFTRPGPSNSYLRVSCACFTNNHHQTLRNGFSELTARFKQARTYATTAAKPARKSRAASRSTTGTKRAGPKKPAAKKQGVRKSKKKVATKPKAKKPRVKKAPTKTAVAQKARAARVELRNAALLDKPKQLPATAYTLLLVAESKGSHGSIAASANSVSTKYRNLSPEERERLNHEANANAQKNAQAYKKWVQSHTPLEIKKANNARKQLTAQAKAAGHKTTYRQIQDDRSVKQPRNAYSYFFGDRYASGDLQGLSVGESAKLIGKEWAQLSDNAKKPYNNKAAADRERYLEEHKSVYGVDSPAIKKPAKAT
ncbi:uncharacterized protein A1O9_07634 [Exophiala aquamarina CBS 119918]|uniref:HMG box domain-containing protein n=1 Tax=Exophiala aquamarina CBS 119918 TaxID=1182545 RepID=A0A072P9U2_9EURO|nr:uncharacterized protein A1O9_07634 [Exophiala aquamarina CBS 119918]KEF56053.1 hypothetical protein A1O9_07634 [Exophiala aquamarina CBS 119918]